MRTLTICLLITGVAATGLTTRASAEDRDGGQLKRARDEVRPKPSVSPPSSRPPSRPSHEHHHHHHGHYHDSGGRSGWLVFGWFGDDSYNRLGDYGPRGLLAYPYADDQRGWLIDGLDAPTDPTNATPVRVRPIGGAIRGEYTDGGDELRRYAGAAQVTFTNLRLETEWHRYIEHLPGDRTDTLTIGNIGVALALPVDNAFTLLVGAGISTYHDAIGTESGWYLKAGAEMFPIRPLVLTTEVWGGEVRADEYDIETFLGGGRATAGVVWNRIEVYGGWQAIWIESVTLDGPTVGMRVWF